MIKQTINENCCPQCRGALTKADGNHKYCHNCDCYFIEHIRCPKCRQEIDCIMGCGTVTYLCRRDGLIPKNNVQYCYLLTE